MLKNINLERMGFSPEEAAKIRDLDSKYSHKIESLVKEYTVSLKDGFNLPYTSEDRTDSCNKAIAFIQEVQKSIPEIDEFASRLLGWLDCVPYLAEIYKKNGISEEIFYDSMKDFSYKFKECEAVHGVFGLFVDWFFLFFDLRLFAFGRLQYELSKFPYEKYTCGETEIEKDDTVYYCHIPSSGKITEEMCLDSFQKVYEFFKPQLNSNIIPIITHTWLFYKPYATKVFPEGSNIRRFAEMFDVIDSRSSGNAFHDAWRVFNKSYSGTTEDLPADNTLRRNFIKYINEGGDFGVGYGIILYDGETGKIINRG